MFYKIIRQKNAGGGESPLQRSHVSSPEKCPPRVSLSFPKKGMWAKQFPRSFPVPEVWESVGAHSPPWGTCPRGTLHINMLAY